MDFSVYVHAFSLVTILCLSNFLPPAADSISKVGNLATPNTKEKFLPPLNKTVWEDNKMSNHTNVGIWECLWCRFHKVSDNHTKALSHVSKVKLLGVNVSLCVAKIPYSRFAIYQALLNKNWGKNSTKKRTQEQIIQDINKLQ